MISRTRLRPFSTYITENRIRRASGPVQFPINFITYIDNKVNLTKEKGHPTIIILTEMGLYHRVFETSQNEVLRRFHHTLVFLAYQFEFKVFE